MAFLPQRPRLRSGVRTGSETSRSAARRRRPRSGASFGQLACYRTPPRPQPPLARAGRDFQPARALSNAAEAWRMGRQSAPKTGTLVKRNLPKKMPSVIGKRYTAAANARSIGSTASSCIRTAVAAARVGWRSGACTERAGDRARAPGANACAGAHTSASTRHEVRMFLRVVKPRDHFQELTRSAGVEGSGRWTGE
eukprot:scaffold16066_cov41-Phaeocystis_antarctica.AAC.2